MTPYERIHNRLQGKPVDKVPNLNILMAFASKFINMSFDKFCLDYKYMVEANIIDIDSMVDFKISIEKFKGHAACANGDFDPVRTLFNGTPNLIKHAVKDCLAIADEKTFISAGCKE